VPWFTVCTTHETVIPGYTIFETGQVGGELTGATTRRIGAERQWLRRRRPHVAMPGPIQSARNCVSLRPRERGRRAGKRPADWKVTFHFVNLGECYSKRDRFLAFLLALFCLLAAGVGNLDYFPGGHGLGSLAGTRELPAMCGGVWQGPGGTPFFGGANQCD
jgi:hypothetical protein